MDRIYIVTDQIVWESFIPVSLFKAINFDGWLDSGEIVWIKIVEKSNLENV